MGCCCLPPDRMKLAVNSKKETNSRVKMGKGSRWASVIYPLKKSKWGCYCLPPDRVKLIVNSKKETNSRVKMGKESKWAKGQNGLLFFTPWQSQTSRDSKKKQTTGSKWAKGQDGLLLFTPWKSQNVLLLFTPWQSQTNWTARKKQRVGSNGAKRSQVGPGPFWLGDNGVKLGQKESSWAWVKLGQAHVDSESNRAKESRLVGTICQKSQIKDFPQNSRRGNRVVIMNMGNSIALDLYRIKIQSKTRI